MKQKEEQWQAIEPDTWKPKEKGDQIIGVLTSTEPKDDKAQLSARYYLQNELGTYLVWGSAVLDNRMKFVKIDDKVRITFEGKEKNKKKQDLNMYKVDVAKNSDQTDTTGTKQQIPEEKVS